MFLLWLLLGNTRSVPCNHFVSEPTLILICYHLFTYCSNAWLYAYGSMITPLFCLLYSEFVSYLFLVILISFIIIYTYTIHSSMINKSNYHLLFECHEIPKLIKNIYLWNRCWKFLGLDKKPFQKTFGQILGSALDQEIFCNSS